MKTATITEPRQRATTRVASYYRGVRVPVTRGEGRFSREEIQRPSSAPSRISQRIPVAEAKPPRSRSVFINCPFDPQYKPLFRTACFVILACRNWGSGVPIRKLPPPARAEVALTDRPMIQEMKRDAN